jgi:hypothetical protein
VLTARRVAPSNRHNPKSRRFELGGVGAEEGDEHRFEAVVLGARVDLESVGC